MPCPFAFAVQVLYGSLSDALVLTFTAPLERVLLIQQSQQSQQEQDENKSKSSSSLSVVLTDLVTHQGLASLWCGNVLRITNTVLARSLSQALNEYFVKQVRLRHQKNDRNSNDKTQELQQELVAGFLAGFVSIAVVYPLNLALVQMSTTSTAARHEKENSVQTCWNNTVQQTGSVTSLFAGLGMTIMGMATHSAVTFGVYNRVMAIVPKTLANNNNKMDEDDKRSKGNNNNNKWMHACLRFGAEQVVHVLAVTAAHPFFTMSVQQQCQVSEKNATALNVTISLLYVGLTTSILKTVMGNAVLAIYHSEAFSCFDFVRQFMMKLFH